MPLWQRAVNLPFHLAGFGIKTFFFIRKGFGKIYIKGLLEGMRMKTGPVKAEPGAYLAAEKWLLKGILLRIKEGFV